MFCIIQSLCRNGSGIALARSPEPSRPVVNVHILATDGTAAKLAAAQPGDAGRSRHGSGVSRQPHGYLPRPRQGAPATGGQKGDRHEARDPRLARCDRDRARGRAGRIPAGARDAGVVMSHALRASTAVDARRARHMVWCAKQTNKPTNQQTNKGTKQCS